MKRALITLAIAFGLFVVAAFVIGWLLSPTSPDQPLQDAATGTGVIAGAALALIGAGAYWWRSGLARNRP